MGFTILETNEGYKYKGQNYKWGEGLVQFLNFNYSDYMNTIQSIWNQSKKTSSNLMNNDLKDEMEIGKFFSPILKYSTNSLHINLLKDALIEFLDMYDPIDEVRTNKND